MAKLSLPENSSFLKNVLTLSTGNAVALAIPAILYPLLSRVFTYEDFALFGLYVSVFSFLEIASAGRYDLTVTIPEKDDDAINLVAGGLIISVLYALVILLLVVFFRDLLALKLNNQSLAVWLFFLPLGLLLVSIGKLGSGWLVRRKNFGAASVNKASQKVAEVSSQLIIGFMRLGNGLILGDIIGRFFNACFTWYQSVRSGLDKGKISREAIKEVLIRYQKFPKYNTLPSMINSLSGMMPVFIISSYFTVAISGSFNFSRIILSVPFAILAAGVSQVLLQQTSERRNKKESVILELYSLITKLAGLSVVGIAVLYFGAPYIFELLFGDQWRQSGEYTSILIFSWGITFIVSPFSILLAVFDKIKYASIWQILYFIGSCALWFFRNLPIEEFLVVLVVFDIVAYTVYGIAIYVAVKKYERSIVAHA